VFKDSLSLKDAVNLALDKNKSLEVSVAARNAAETGVSGPERLIAEG